MVRTLLLATTVIASNTSPGLGQIGAFYFDAQNESQIWMNVEPQNLEPGPSHLRLNVTVSFPGRTLSSPPHTVELRVDDNCAAFPLRLRTPEFVLIYDGIPVRAGAAGFPILFSSSCGEETGSTNAMTMRVPFTVLRQIVTARNVELRAFGFPARVASGDLALLNRLVSALEHGVRVSTGD